MCVETVMGNKNVNKLGLIRMFSIVPAFISLCVMSTCFRVVHLV